MKIVIAIDSLKGSLSSIEAGQAIKEGILNVYKSANIKIVPIADGGEGTIDALVNGMGGDLESIQVTGPIGKKINSKYGIIKSTNTGIIEMAQASGIILVPEKLRNPLNTTSYGVGEIIKDSINKGVRNFIVGIGGSATNDCGVGMLQALGYEFYDENGGVVGLGGNVLNKIKYISTKNKIKELDKCTFKVACDVNNPLYGENGAAYIYGPQKGATEEVVKELDNGLINFSNVVKSIIGEDKSKVEGSGAAGGLGFAFLSFFKSSLQPGIDIVLNEVNLEQWVKDADFVITGEGRLDNQTAMGKAPIGVAKLAKKYGSKVIAIAGSTASDAIVCNEQGIDAYFSIVNSIMTIDEAIQKDNARRNIIDTVTQIFNLIKLLR